MFRPIHALFLMLFFAFLTGEAQLPEPQFFKAVRISEDLKLSGKLDDPRWAVSNQVQISYEAQPGENIPAPQRTTVRILYNNGVVKNAEDGMQTRLTSG